MPDKSTESRLIFAQLATLGLTLFGLYEFAPFFIDEAWLPGWEQGAEGAGKVMSRIPWVKVASVGSLLPYAVLVSRVIPRRVKLEHRPRGVERVRREDALGQESLLQSEG
jgi:hypothetical protein